LPKFGPLINPETVRLFTVKVRVELFHINSGLPANEPLLLNCTWPFNPPGSELAAVVLNVEYCSSFSVTNTLAPWKMAPCSIKEFMPSIPETV
jgi:hypothetical protein